LLLSAIRIMVAEKYSEVALI